MTIGAPLKDALVMRLGSAVTATKGSSHLWRVAGCNAIADTRDIAAVWKRVNGGHLGLEAVRPRFNAAMDTLKG